MQATLEKIYPTIVMNLDEDFVTVLQPAAVLV